MKNNILFLVW